MKMVMTRTREAAAERLLVKLERAMIDRTDARCEFANLPAGIESATFDEYVRRKRAAEARFAMLRTTTWRALVNSTEEL